MGSLRATGVPEEVCRRLLRVLQEDQAGLQGLEKPWRIQMAFRRGARHGLLVGEMRPAGRPGRHLMQQQLASRGGRPSCATACSAR